MQKMKLLNSHIAEAALSLLSDCAKQSIEAYWGERRRISAPLTHLDVYSGKVDYWKNYSAVAFFSDMLFLVSRNSISRCSNTVSVCLVKKIFFRLR